MCENKLPRLHIGMTEKLTNIQNNSNRLSINLCGVEMEMEMEKGTERRKSRPHIQTRMKICQFNSVYSIIYTF